MNFDDTPEEAEFRASVRRWLEDNAEPGAGRDPAQRYLSDAFSADEAEHIRASKAWQRKLYDAGWAGITWQAEYGGRGGTTLQQMIFSEEEARVGKYSTFYAVGIGMIGPTLMAHGTQAQKDRHLGPVLRGDEVWCQLFSEPAAGSDLAGVQTRAVRTGDEYVVSGQKVWTSGAHYCDYAALLARTDPDQPKHKGLTYFILDLRAPGIDIRPLRQMTGAAHFNEVFLDEVRIPAASIVGGVNDGWRVALTTLTNERSQIGGGGGRGDDFSHVRELARERGRTTDPVIRQRLAAIYTQMKVISFLGLRMRTRASQGTQPGPESALMKIARSRGQTMVANLALDLEGASGMLADGTRGETGWSEFFLGHFSVRLGGGTDQIMQNVIGERILGLPADLRIDKDVPYREIRRN